MPQLCGDLARHDAPLTRVQPLFDSLAKAPLCLLLLIPADQLTAVLICLHSDPGEHAEHRSFVTYTSTLTREALEDLLRPEDFLVESALQRALRQLW